MTKFTKWKKWQKLIQGLYPNHVHISRPWHKHVQSFIKIGIKLYEELRSQGTHCLLTNINSRIISKSYANLQTMAKTCTKVQKDQYKIVWGVALTRYPLSQHFHRIWGQKWQSSQSGKSNKNKRKDYIQIICTSSDHGENMCKVSKRLV